MHELMPIAFSESPFRWFNDKIKTALNNPQLFAGATVSAGLNVASLILALYALVKSSLLIVQISLILLFVYGIINGILLGISQRLAIRIKRHENNNNVMHRDIIEVIRRYHSRKEQTKLNVREIEDCIRELLQNFNRSYMRETHNKQVSATVKYLFDNNLYSIRDGRPEENRSEPMDDSYVYGILVRPGRVSRKLYIKDIANPSVAEAKMFGESADKLKNRAQSRGYSTLFAVLIHSGPIYDQPKPSTNGDDQGVVEKSNLGFLGFDHPNPYGLGNIYQHEVDYICCFADLLSEPLKDIQIARMPTNQQGGRRNARCR